MRNLQQLSSIKHDVSSAVFSCFAEGCLFTATKCEELISIARLGSAKKITGSFDAPDIAPDVPDQIIDLHYSEEEDALCVIMHGGDIIQITVNSGGDFEPAEIIGTVDQNVLAAQWSPDGDILAVATATTLSLLTKSFESLAQIQIAESDIQTSANQISVGWGRAETQFRGKHAPRDPTLPETVDRGVFSPNDDGQASISWRGDAAFLALSMKGPSRRVIRVYSRDGLLESTSEPVDGQEGLVAWKPSGSIIASVQTSVINKCIFFEKNGLRHGEFDLRQNSCVTALKWNSDSSVLLVQYADHAEFWVASNYHYALKAAIPVSSSTRALWHPEQPLTILLTSTEEVCKVEFIWEMTTHKPVAPHDFGLMAVIDGHNIKLTPMRIANVPPPMSFRSLDVGHVPRSVAIANDARTLSVLFEQEMRLYHWDLTQRPIKSPSLSKTVPLEMDVGDHAVQVCFNDQDHAAILLASGNVLSYTETALVKVQCSSKFPSSIHPYGDEFVIQDRMGQLSSINCGSIVASLPEYCSTIKSAQLHDAMSLFGLSNAGKLYADSRQISSKVTSFLLVDRVLAYTTTNYLKFIHLDQALEDVPDETDSEQCRQIERGSLLVCCSPSAQSITLQAPRGNLETIYPRLLVLAGIRRSLSLRRWQEAWRNVKVHRIDSNIMCDHDRELFYTNMKEFITQLGDSAELDLFLSSLKAEDVTETMYRDTGLTSAFKGPDSALYADKVNQVCNKVLELLSSDFSTTHLTSILTAHLSKAPADYEAVLRIITSLPKEDVENALTHACFLADPHLLYNHALGLYDLPLALLLAQRSQKDPREYVPFLQNMQKLPKDRQQYALDDYLGRHAKALVSLLAVEDAWEETIGYIQRHKLWTEALHSLKYDQGRYLSVVSFYAEYLMEVQDFADAGFAFELVGNNQKATEAFESAALWPEAIYAAALCDIDHEALCTRMAELMVERSRYIEAAEIYKDHLHDFDSAITLYCRGYRFAQAILLARSAETIARLVKPALTESFVQISELLAEMRTQLQNQLPRLREVRVKRDDNPDGYFEGMVEEDTPDNISLAGTQASTTASIYTRYTGTTAMTTQSKRSAKGRRRQERQRAKGKKGTIWEEEYLVNSVRRLVERLEETRVDARSLVVALVRCDMRESASEIQKSMISLIALARANLDEVFVGILTLPPELQRTMGTKPILKEFEVFNLC